MKEIAVVIPVYGNNNLTHNLLNDIRTESDLVEVYIVDNKGNYESVDGEIVLRSKTNLGWVRGTNLGLEKALKSSHKYFVLLNNDTRLSPAFFRGLVDSYQETKAGLIGPLYDDVWLHQLMDNSIEAQNYIPVRRFDKVPFVDGTCMFIPREVTNKVGLLDHEHFGKYGWGADLEYGLRVRNTGYDVVVTHLAYLNHERGSTAKVLIPNYNKLAGEAMITGFCTKWGDNWKDKILTYNGKLYQPKNYKTK